MGVHELAPAYLLPVIAGDEQGSTELTYRIPVMWVAPHWSSHMIAELHVPGKHIDQEHWALRGVVALTKTVDT